MPVQSVDHDCESSPTLVFEAFRHGLIDADLSEKAAAYMMGVDPAQLSRQLHGEGHLPADRLPKLGLRFQRAFIAHWAESLGMRVVSEDISAAKLRRVLHAITDALTTLEAER